MPEFLVKFLICCFSVLFWAGPAPAEEFVIQQGDGPVSITSHNRKPAPAKPAEPAKTAPGTGPGATVPAASGQQVPMTPEQQTTLATIQAVLDEYSAKNKYSELTETQCKQMSEAIWYRLRVKGLEVLLAAGNIERNVVGVDADYFVRYANHAWVMAQTPQQGWMALECTSGRIVPAEENGLYYSGGLFFRNPDEVYKFDARRRDMVNAAKRYHKLKARWDDEFKDRPLRTDSELFVQREKLRAEIIEAEAKFNDAVDRLNHLFNNAYTIKRTPGGQQQ